MRLSGAKRLLVLVAAFALVLAACGSDADGTTTTSASESVDEPATTVAETVDEPTTTVAEAAAPVTIKLLLRPDEGGNIEKFAAEFEAATGHTVEVDFVGWGEIYNKTLTTLASGGGGYDIVFLPSANVLEFTSTGLFEPVDDVIPADQRSDWLASVLDLYTVDGDLLGMPWYSGGAHMAYNVSVLEAAGVDPSAIKTTDDLLAACEAVKTAGSADWCFTPSAKYPGNFYYSWGSLSATTGEDLFDADGAPAFADNGSAEFGFDLIATGIEAGYFDPAGVALDDFETLIAFGTGSTAFLLDSTWAVTQAERNEEFSSITGNVGYILIPGSGVESDGYLYAGGMGLMTSSENKAVAKELMTFLTSAEVQKHHAIEGANLPTRVALFSDPAIAEAWTGFDTLALQLEFGQFPPQFDWFEEWRQTAASLTQDVLRGDKTAAEATAELEAETDRLREG